MKPVRDPEPIALFGMRIRTLRQQQNMTQQAVADLLQIDRTTYTKYEAGRVSPDNQGLVRLAEIFGCTVDSLLGVADGEQQFQVASSGQETMLLTNEEQILLQLFRQLSPEERSALAERVQKSFREKQE